MNKLLPVIVLVVLLVGGGVFLLSQKDKMSPQNMMETVKDQVEDKLAFTSIQDALNKSLSLECNYTDKEGTTSKTYIKAGAVRTEVTSADDTEGQVFMIMKDKKIYNWNPVTKKGTVFTLPDELNVTPQVKPSGMMENEVSEDTHTKEESFMAQIEKYKDACKPATVADSLFVPPTDVTFQDLSSMMENVNKMMPTGAIPSGFNMDDLKKYMPPAQ